MICLVRLNLLDNLSLNNCNSTQQSFLQMSKLIKKKEIQNGFKKKAVQNKGRNVQKKKKKKNQKQKYKSSKTWKLKIWLECLTKKQDT